MPGGPDDRWLEAQFRQEGARWQVRLVPQSEAPRPWRPWRRPDDPRQLFRSLFDPDQDRDLVARPWRLRLRPETLSLPPAPMPSVDTWSCMEHPVHRTHVQNLRWTLAEMVVEAHHGNTNGKVTVVGDDALAAALSAGGTPHVGVAKPDAALPSESIVVVHRDLPDEVMRALQREAFKRRCPLVVWCCDARPPRGEQAEVIQLTRPREPAERWLGRFLAALMAGHDPERALALAGDSGPVEDRAARWLRGAFDGWTVRGLPSRLPDLLRDWKVKLDRSAEEHELTQHVDSLVQQHVKRRVQVVIVPGDAGAGLDLFRQRPLRLLANNPIEVTQPPWEIPWAPTPAETLDEWCRWTDSGDPVDLAQRLLHRVPRGARMMFHVVHPVASVDPTSPLPRVTPHDLAGYLDRLDELAHALEDQPLRVLVHASLQGATRESLGALKRNGPFLRVSVLPALSLRVPANELREWFEREEIEPDEALIEEILQQVKHLTYEDLLGWLERRYPQKLRPR